MVDFATKLQGINKDDHIEAYQIRLIYEYIESTIKRLEKYDNKVEGE